MWSISNLKAEYVHSFETVAFGVFMNIRINRFDRRDFVQIRTKNV